LGLFSLNLTTNSNAFLFSSKNKDIAAKVNGEIITKEDFKKKLESLNFVTKDNKEAEQKTKRDCLEMLISDKLVGQKAKKLDLSQDSVWKMKERKHSLEFLTDLLYKKEVAEKAPVGDSEITAYYNENLDKIFTKPEEFKISHILIKVEEDTLQKKSGKKKDREKEALEKIEPIYQRAKNGEDFAALAKEFSEEDGSKEKGGELGYLPRGRMLKEFEEQISSLQPNEVSRPFRTKFGYHILKYTDKKPSEVMELNDDLKEKIKYNLARDNQKKRAEEYLKDLQGRTKYLFNEEVLNQNPDSVKDDPWVLIIENQDTTKFSQYRGDIGRYKSYLKKNTLTLEDKKKLLMDYTSLFNLLVFEGKRAGYDKLPEYVQEMDALRMDEAKSRIINQGILQGYVPSDSEAYDYYLSHRDEFPPDSSLHVYHIIFSDSLKAEEVLKKIKEGADFVEMAKEYYPGEKEIRDVAYDLGYISDKEISPEFYKAAALLQVGEVSTPLKTEWGYHLIKLVERKSDSPMELNKSKIKNLVFNEKTSKLKADWERKLREGEQIWINEKLVKKFKL
jgi:parvulin-like peptidyl-prolyl isomerase